MGQNWVCEETSECNLGDVRLNRRLGAILAAIGERPGKSLPTAFQDWANTKAAYRFFANESVSEDKILEGHFAASALRIKATDGPILILQDTTEFSFKRVAPETIGFTKVATGPKGKDRRYQKHKVCGLLMHASPAITPEGLPLGLTAAKFWSRDKFKGSIKFTTMTVRPPIGKQKKYQHQKLQIIHAEELNPPTDRPAIFWKPITNLPVENHDDAVHKLGWYARRWNIETFFKTLKTGCKIEDVRLTTADRLANYIALCCVVAWRISWLTILRRQAPTTAPAAVFTQTERILLERKMPDSRKSATRDLAFYMTAVARLGGYLDRNSDPPPGTTVIWRGFSRLADLDEGFQAVKADGRAFVGN